MNKLSTIIQAGNQNIDRMQNFCDIMLNAKSVYITGSGTSYHSALIAKQIFAKFAKIRAETIMSSEFQYVHDLIDSNSVLIAISQSGESSDVLQSVKTAKQKGAKILSVVNIQTSSLARISDSSLGVNCGPEIGVAATKSFTGQVSLIYHIADKLCNNCIGFDQNNKELIRAIEFVLDNESKIAEIADNMKDVKDIYLLGRSLHYPLSPRRCAKIKRISICSCRRYSSW